MADRQARERAIQKASEKVRSGSPYTRRAGEKDPLEGMRPASKAHVKLEAAVLMCLESGVYPETILRFVCEALPNEADSTEDGRRSVDRSEAGREFSATFPAVLTTLSDPQPPQDSEQAP